MKHTLTHLWAALGAFSDEEGFLAGRIALVIVILALIVVFAVIAFLIPGSD